MINSKLLLSLLLWWAKVSSDTRSTHRFITVIMFVLRGCYVLYMGYDCLFMESLPVYSMLHVSELITDLPIGVNPIEWISICDRLQQGALAAHNTYSSGGLLRNWRGVSVGVSVDEAMLHSPRIFSQREQDAIGEYFRLRSNARDRSNTAMFTRIIYSRQAGMSIINQMRDYTWKA